MSSVLVAQYYESLLLKLVPTGNKFRFYVAPPLVRNMHVLNDIWSFLNGADLELHGDEEYYEWLSISELYLKLGHRFETKRDFGREFLETWVKGSGIEMLVMLDDNVLTPDSFCIRLCPLLLTDQVVEALEEGEDPEEYRNMMTILSHDPCYFHHEEQKEMRPFAYKDIEFCTMSKLEDYNSDVFIKLDPEKFSPALREYWNFSSSEFKDKHTM